VDPKDARAAFNLACLNHRNFMTSKLATSSASCNKKKDSELLAQEQTASASAASGAVNDDGPMKAVAAQYNRVLELWPQCRPAHLHLGLLYQEGSPSSTPSSAKGSSSSSSSGGGGGGGRSFFNDVARVHYREVLRFCGNGRGMHRHPDWPPPRYITEENQGVQAVANAELRAPHWRANLQKAQQQQEEATRMTASMQFNGSRGDAQGGGTMMTATFDGQSIWQWGATLGNELRGSVTTPEKPRASTIGGTLPAMMPLREEATADSSSETASAALKSASQALYSGEVSPAMPPQPSSSWHPQSTLLPTNGSSHSNRNSSSRRGSYLQEEPLSPLSPLSPQSPFSPSSRTSFSAGFQVASMVGKAKRRSSISKKALKAAAASASTTAFAEAPYADYRSQVQATRSDGAYALRLALDAHTKVSADIRTQTKQLRLIISTFNSSIALPFLL
jgi:hypothetical protein